MGMPFRVPFLNATEIVMCFSLSLTMAVTSAHTSANTGDARDIQSMLFLITASTIILLTIFAFRVAFVSLKSGISVRLEEDRVCSLGYMVVDVISLAGHFKNACSDVDTLDEKDLVKCLRHMAVYDVWTLHKTVVALGPAKNLQEHIESGSVKVKEEERGSAEVPRTEEEV